ncbi:MAG TPA: prepilin-type N-terminal cleavage/methylation domain-containing protein [Acidobacteriota bacterium]
MKKMKISRRFCRKQGFTLIELLVGSLIMLIVLVATLSLYSRSNKTTIDQQQYADLQNNVRAGMYFIAKDVRSAGVGLLPEVAGYFLEGTDAESPGTAGADSIRLMGNFDEPLNLHIDKYQGGIGGGSAQASLYAGEFLNAPYPCPDFYVGRTYFIISVKCPGCYAFRYLDPNKAHGCDAGTEHLVFDPGSSALNPPGGLVDPTQNPNCGATCWDDAIITLGQIKFYWLDTTGSLTAIKEIALQPGQDGYLGQAGVLYVSTALNNGTMTHLPLARNIENLQFQYRVVNDDGSLADFQNWDNAGWTILAGDTEADRTAKMDFISKIRQVRMWVQGRTERPFVSVSGTPPAGANLYKRPAIANSPVDNAVTVDRHRRFVLESTSNIRNMSLSLYNLGTR